MKLGLGSLEAQGFLVDPVVGLSPRRRAYIGAKFLLPHSVLVLCLTVPLALTQGDLDFNPVLSLTASTRLSWVSDGHFSLCISLNFGVKSASVSTTERYDSS